MRIRTESSNKVFFLHFTQSLEMRTTCIVHRTTFDLYTLKTTPQASKPIESTFFDGQFFRLKPILFFSHFVCDNLIYLQSVTFHLVTKTLITDPLWNGVLQPYLSFLKEAHFYSDVIPAIEQFERDANVPEAERVNAFIRFFGCRLSLDTSKCMKIDSLCRVKM